MSSDSDSSQAQSPTSQYREAIATYRTSIKWVISSFGAVAAALLVGVQLTSLGNLHGSKLFWAFFSLAVAFLSILLIIYMAVRVLSPIGGTYAGFERDPTFKPLNAFLRTDKTPLRKKATSAPELASRYEAALDLEQETWNRYRVRKDDAALKGAYAAAQEERRSLAPVVQSVTTLGIFLCTRKLFRQAMAVLFVGVALAATGSVAFAYLATSSAAQGSAPAAKVVIAARLPLNCAGYYLALEKVSRGKPRLARHWPGRAVGPQAKACGFETKGELTEFLSHFLRRE